MSYARALGDSSDEVYYVEQMNAIAANQTSPEIYIGSPDYTNDNGLIFIGYPRGVVPAYVQTLLDAGLEPGTVDFNNAAVTWLRANSRLATPADIGGASAYVPPPAPAPVVAPVRYLVDGVYYDTLAAATAAAAAGPSAPPVSDTGTIHLDPSANSYLPGPTPAGTSSGTTLNPGNLPVLVDPQPAGGDPTLAVAGAMATDAPGGLSGRTIAIGAAVGLGLLFLSKRTRA